MKFLKHADPTEGEVAGFFFFFAYYQSVSDERPVI
jgi:hypothetical protein